MGIRNYPRLAIGVDIGGTEIKVGLIAGRGNILQIKKFTHNIPSNANKILKQLSKVIKTLNLWTDKQLVSRLSGIGIAVAGDIDPRNGISRFSANFGWRNVHIKKILEKEFNVPIIVDNDANAACWGSYCIEFKKSVNNLICLTLGTGVGGGLVMNGKLYHGSAGRAGELGHVTLYPEGKKCTCGNRGCLERYVGAYDLVSEVRRKIRSGEKSIMTKLINNDFDEITPEVIYRAACKNDKFAKRIWARTGEYLGIVIASLVNVLNPEIIVLSGGISGAGRYLCSPIKNTVKLRAFKSAANKARVVISKLGKDLGLIGAGCLVLYPSND